jgi:AraC-like DNA-binding protein
MVEGDGTTLADTAAACGYSDQSHFTREFGAFVGCTPAAYRAARFADLPGTPASVLEA